MRLVVDTNICVSAALKEASWPGNTLRRIAKYGGLLKSTATEHEVIAVLQRPRFAPKIAPFFLDSLRQLLAGAEMVTITETISACRDPDDDKFPELAVNGHADVIIPGDDDLLSLDALVNGTSVVQVDAVDQLSYFHVELDTHDVILAEGAPSETFVDDDNRGMFHNADAFYERYPDARRQPARYCRPRVEDGDSLEAVRHRLAARGGPAQAAPPGTLRGRLDEIDRERISGWAQDDAEPDRPVRLRILDNLVAIGEVVADRYRPDLAAAGIGRGCHSFELIVLGGLSPLVRHVIEVQRAADGQALDNSPLTIEAAPPIILNAASDPTCSGYIDVATRDHIKGWARDDHEPKAPVALVILDNGVPIARVLANAYRRDVELPGYGDGRYGFEIRIPGGLSPLTRHVIAVRRESDGSDIPCSPMVIEAAGGRAERLAHRKFRRRWGLQADSVAPPDPRLRALVIDGQVPAADRDAGSQAIFSHMRALQRLGYEVSFVAAGEMERPAPSLAAAGISLCRAPFYASVEEVLRRQAGCFEIIYLHRAEIAARYLALARSHGGRGGKILYSVADLHHVRLARQAAVEHRPALLAASRRMRASETMAAWSADAVITHSAAEAEILRQAVPHARVHRVPWEVAVRATAVPFAQRHGIAFIGNYGHAPNIDAAHWLAEAVMPLVRQADPAITCLLVGADMPDRVRRLAGPGVEAIGRVGDLGGQVFDRVRLTVAPLRFGAGIKGKVLDSLAAGVPCVMSECAAEGLSLPPLLQGLIGRDAAALAALIVRLHADEVFCHAVMEAGLGFIRQGFSQDAVTTALRVAITGVAAEEQAESASFGKRSKTL